MKEGGELYSRNCYWGWELYDNAIFEIRFCFIKNLIFKTFIISKSDFNIDYIAKPPFKVSILLVY
jgi:hypothetical protein